MKAVDKSTMVIAVYRGDNPIFVGPFSEACATLSIAEHMMSYYLTPSGRARSEKLENGTYAVRVEEDGDEDT